MPQKQAQYKTFGQLKSELKWGGLGEYKYQRINTEDQSLYKQARSKVCTRPYARCTDLAKSSLEKRSQKKNFLV